MLCEGFSTIDSVGLEENKREFNGDCIVQKAGGEKLVLGALSNRGGLYGFNKGRRERGP